jgi:4-aminobutyrate aminotransferase-like enzyme
VERVAAAAAIPIGGVLVEPIQGRGGERVPPPGFLTELAALCRRNDWLLVADEVYTGFGRTGAWFACDHEGVIPDLLCVGKGLASGMPISACLGRLEVMDAWPVSSGEALHTQTFIGHPAGCAAALASMRLLQEEKLVERAARVGARAISHLEALLADRSSVREVRGRGLMIGIECATPEAAASACRAALAKGVIVLPSGEAGRVLSLTPPLSIDQDILMQALDWLVEDLG